MTHIANCMRLPEDKPGAAYGIVHPSDTRVSTGKDSSKLYKRGSHLGTSTASRQIIYQLRPSYPPKRPLEKVPSSSPQPFISPDRAMALAIGRSPSSLSDTAVTLEHHQSIWQMKPWGGDLYRRRKVSVPELSAAMATVQENSLDSPTIPGRPALLRSASAVPVGHERCSSAPGNAWHQGPFGDALLSCVTGPAPLRPDHWNRDIFTSDSPHSAALPYTSQISKKPLSPILSPTAVPRPVLKVDTKTTLVDDDNDVPPRPPPKSPLMSRRGSPALRRMNSDGKIAPLFPAGPQSAPALEGRRSPNFSQGAGSISHRAIASATERKKSPISEMNSSLQARPLHSRNQSDNTIMDRGRPYKQLNRERSRTCSETGKSAQTDTWHLPPGVRLSEALIHLPDDERASLHKQSMYQAEKFAVLHKKDVTVLSRELRALDERCEYLRKTYKSLRDGRQKLHCRMISYLKRTEFVFSRESLLKQEEALAELDTSIDDWILKLEQAENRRLRVRQKLLEHVAAALLLDSEHSRPMVVTPTTPPRSPIKVDSPRRGPERREVESIKIYADGRALDLFSDIQQAIGQLCEPSA
ncbi:hypothetical protein EJ05DRAFT_535357 [Pseudovirgaria hyperparasitica]|uniref:Up-regulated during septation protein 1 domain-containing protein n=1 Tax=Pseudovirgaria hyperparasitica TaxID=470096 RepID=A0A6A6WIY8_9PEZI|nr:uncharacterized protein EJ05DRAFT_535357 [Pseudovirgaria hyperparasitica]KAF2762076.1 hypothetical protein EJ05DRAFT_535357 [Pseudovirgaria hyperparasitica]